MRRIFSILFSIYFLYNIIGYYPIFLFQKNNIEKEIQRISVGNISNDQVAVISLNINELQKLSWLKENEFSFQDKLYDVIKIEKRSNNEILFYCIEDHKEKDLIVNFEKHIAQHMDDGARNHTNCSTVYKKLNYDFYFFEFDRQNFQLLQKIDFACLNNFYNSAYLEKHTPPPKYL